MVDLGTMGSAEYSLGGAQVNSIPKSGGNLFSGSFFLAGTGSGLQSDNLDDDLRSQGLTSVNTVKKVYDYQRRLRRAGGEEPDVVLCLRPALGHDDQRREPVRRREHRTTSVYTAGSDRAASSPVENDKARPADA